MLTAALVTAAGGCGAGSGPSAGSTGSAGSAGQASASPRVGGSHRPATGAQLKGLLPAQASLPSGWVLSSGTGQETDSGTALTAPPYLPVLPRQSCASWKGVDAHFLLAGDQASAAQLSVTVGQGKNTSLGSVNLAGYYPGWAARQFTLITSFAEHRCAPFSTRDEITGARVEMRPSVTTVPGLGGQALLIKIIQVNGPLPDGTYYPGDYLLVARVGDYLADVDAPAFPGRSPGKAARSLMSALAGRLGRLG
ncbi:MAG: hypothetical protein ACRDND_16260 [Streptosporangiaceae bacterium]